MAIYLFNIYIFLTLLERIYQDMFYKIIYLFLIISSFYKIIQNAHQVCFCFLYFLFSLGIITINILDFIKNILICVLSMNYVRTGLEQHEGE